MAQAPVGVGAHEAGEHRLVTDHLRAGGHLVIVQNWPARAPAPSAPGRLRRAPAATREHRALLPLDGRAAGIGHVPGVDAERQGRCWSRGVDRCGVGLTGGAGVRRSARQRRPRPGGAAGGARRRGPGGPLGLDRRHRVPAGGGCRRLRHRQPGGRCHPDRRPVAAAVGPDRGGGLCGPGRLLRCRAHRPAGVAAAAPRAEPRRPGLAAAASARPRRLAALAGDQPRRRRHRARGGGLAGVPRHPGAPQLTEHPVHHGSRPIWGIPRGGHPAGVPDRAAQRGDHLPRLHLRVAAAPPAGASRRGGSAPSSSPPHTSCWCSPCRCSPWA